MLSLNYNLRKWNYEITNEITLFHISEICRLNFLVSDRKENIVRN